MIKTFGTEYEDAVAADAINPAPASQEGYFTGLMNHIKENKMVYYGLLAVAAFVVYKKFFAKK